MRTLLAAWLALLPALAAASGDLPEAVAEALKAAREAAPGGYGSCPLAIAQSEGPIYFPDGPAEAPDFELKNPEGRSGRLSWLRGTVVLVEFMSTSCEPCRAAGPALAELSRLYGQRVFVVSIAVDEQAAAAAAFAAEHALPHPILLDPGGAVAAEYKVRAVPAFVVIDPEGKEAWRITGWSDRSARRLREALDRVLARQRPHA